MQEEIKAVYGDIDIYLFDQLLKGTYSGCRSVLDAGCGTGRNLVYFLRQGLDVYGVDLDTEAVLHCREGGRTLYGSAVEEHFQVASVEELPFGDERFDLVISSAVLHFARSLDHFEAMLSSMWRVLRPGGYFFCRLASDIGIESSVRFIGNGRYLLPDGSERFLVNQEMLIRLAKKLGGTLHEPIKTTNVQNMRSMTTWCIKK
jgi:SAM-dependent methyltransferase